MANGGKENKRKKGKQKEKKWKMKIKNERYGSRAKRRIYRND